MDSQSIEIVGRNLLVSELVRDGVEVARPERDRGVDLLVYLDLDDSGVFRACPIQLKASTNASFSLSLKYERFANMILAYVWAVGSVHETFALTYPEALAVATAMRWTSTRTWVETGTYSTSRPTARLRELLEPHRMAPGRWLEKVRLAASLPVAGPGEF